MRDGMDVLARRQEAIDALLGVLNDIGGGQRDNYNVSYEAAAKALDATGLLTDERGAVSSWPSARNVIEAVREGRLGLDALREVVTILDIHLGGQSEPSAPWPAWADSMRPRSQS